MDERRFDRLTRLLGGSVNRRTGLRSVAALVVGAFTRSLGGAEEVNAKPRRRRKRIAAQGPCGNGSGKANKCNNDNACCTGYCRKGRCRCKKPGQGCSEDRNCCPNRRGYTCRAGTCQLVQLVPTSCSDDAACPGSAPTCCGTPGSCTSITSDPNNCGACGIVCDAGKQCVDGACFCGDVCASGCEFSTVEDAINAAADGDTITVCAGEYATAGVTLTKRLTIRGAGAGLTILNGKKTFRIFEVKEASSVVLQNLTITGGNDNLGGGLLNRGMLTLEGVDVTGNKAGTAGGGIFNFIGGTLLLETSHVTRNVAGSNGGGIYTNDPAKVIISEDSTVTDNTPNNCHPEGMIANCKN